MNTRNQAGAQGDNAAASDAGRKGSAQQDVGNSKADVGKDGKGRNDPPPGQRAFEEGNESDSRSIEADDQGSGGGQLSQGGSSDRSSQK